MGGMGKTTLAQLVYNDPQVQQHFDSKLWVCVSDVFNIKTIIEQILMSATNLETPKLDMDSLLSQLRGKIGHEKYFLVLDDMWNENREERIKLKDLLKICEKGSKILVTTRSWEVAEVMGTCPPHELLGLSEEKSWDLFEMKAFKRGEADKKPNLVKIIKKCGCVPLAIRALGSLLYGKEESKWVFVKDTSLGNIPENQSGIMKILKVSYNHLWSPLKNCFSYCAMFPKDYEFRKEMLTELWMAEGFIGPANQGQSLEDVTDEYFQILLQRCFFQDVKRNEWGQIERCKMHDLMHDLAEEVAGAKCKVTKFGDTDFDEKIVHLSFAYTLTSLRDIPKCIPNLKLLRTFMLLKQMIDMGPSGISKCPRSLMRFSSLRVLDVSHLDFKSLPSSIGKLIHLRYLNLSFTLIEKLPDSLTDLWNLQTLRLRFCWNLRTLPTDMKKLTNLRCLDLDLCDQLTHFPSGLKELTSLNKLPQFIVGYEHSTAKSKNKTTNTAKLSDLKNLNNLRGELKILIHCDSNDYTLEETEADLISKYGLTDLKVIFWREEDDAYVDCDHDEVVLDGLKPHSNLRSLHINGYRGLQLPNWARMGNLCITLPNLAEFTLSRSQSCQQLPILSQLRVLKYLRISGVDSVEYMEGVVSDIFPTSYSQDLETTFFPSLEEVALDDVQNLKGWWKEEEIECKSELEGASYELDGQRFPKFIQFSKLSKLSISGCLSLRMLPLCPNVEELTLTNNNENLLVSKMAKTLSSSTTMSSSSEYGWKLKRLTIDNAEDLLFLPNHCLCQLTILTVLWDTRLESIERLGEVFATVSSSLQSLDFSCCGELRSISKGLEHLTVLESLEFYNCEELDIGVFEDEDGMPWKDLNTSLRSLKLNCLPKLVDLPRGLGHLTNLRSLELSSNEELKELPEWISCLSSLEYLGLSECPKLQCLPEAFCNLTSLNQLRIVACPGLMKRCQRSNGSDWSKIQHIPMSIREGLLF